MSIFQKSRSWLRTIFNTVVEFLFQRFQHLVYWNVRRLSYEQLEEYSNAIARKGGVDGIWGFIDGTMRAICQPVENQRLYYTGYKRFHAVKYQTILTPDGLISSLAGPYLGKEGDLANVSTVLYIHTHLGR